MDVRAVDPVDRYEIVDAIKSRFCVGCDSYDGVRCRACNFDDALDAIDSVPSFDLSKIRELVPQWISVEDRLPNEPGEVLVVLYGRVCVAWYHCEGRFESSSGMVWSAGENVTHWMPLPEPPKEG